MECRNCGEFDSRYKKNKIRYGVCKKHSKPVKEDDECNGGKYSESAIIFQKVMRAVAKSYTDEYAKSKDMTQTDKVEL
jgi:hypothetical protein